eukprot:5454495-Pyramimonas_sp.AAC.1
MAALPLHSGGSSSGRQLEAIPDSAADLCLAGPQDARLATPPVARGLPPPLFGDGRSRHLA